MEALHFAITVSNVVLFLVLNHQLGSYRKSLKITQEAIVNMAIMVAFDHKVLMDKLLPTDKEYGEAVEKYASVCQQTVHLILAGGNLLNQKSGSSETE